MRQKTPPNARTTQRLFFRWHLRCQDVVEVIPAIFRTNRRTWTWIRARRAMGTHCKCLAAGRLTEGGSGVMKTEIVPHRLFRPANFLGPQSVGRVRGCSAVEVRL